MKRALAERAKQSLNAVHSQPLSLDHSENHTALLPVGPQAPQIPQLSHSHPQAPYSDASHSNGSIKEVELAHHRYRKSPMEDSYAPPDDGALDTTSERPPKVPRLDPSTSHSIPPIPSIPSVPPIQSIPPIPSIPSIPPIISMQAPADSTNANASSVPAMPAVPSAGTSVTEQIQRTHPRPPLAPPPVPTAAAARRNSMDPSHKKLDESDTSFYLKHQNRALATELKSLQYAVSQLETERDVRRTQCHQALQAMHEIGIVWHDILHQTVGTLTESAAIRHRPDDATWRDPPSTGTGPSVEWTRALHQSIVALGHPSQLENSDPLPTDANGPLDRGVAPLDTDSWSRTLELIQSSARGVQDYIRRIRAAGAVPTQDTDAVLLPDQPTDVPLQLATVNARCTELQAQLTELAASRTDVVARERRVRRNIYRLAAGMLTPDQVVKTLEEGEEDGDIQAAIQLEQTVTERRAVESIPVADVNHVPSALVAELREQIQSLTEAVTNGESAIQELNALLIEKQHQISELSKRQLSDDDTTKLESLLSTQFQLKASEQNATGLHEKLEQTREKWAQSLGNEKAAMGAVDELVSKFNKRWLEFSNTSNANVELDADGSVAAPADTAELVMARKMAELQHQLNQALENVRQSEITRDNLKVALTMNGSLQSKLDEVKGKYAALRTSQVPDTVANAKSAAATLGSAAPTATSEPKNVEPKISEPKNSEPRNATSRHDDEKIEKLKSQYRRARKDLAAMTVSRDSSKSKFERAEKERDGLMESNVRLLKQMSEKDDMNAKSLSTILHLKSLTEKLAEERECLEQQMKSASQLAMSARLATNAKERVSEEMLKEKKAADDRVQELERQYQALQVELDRVSGEWSEASGKMAVKESELTYAWKRSDELAAENEAKREEIRKLVDLVSKAERESREAKDKLAKAVKSGDVNGDEVGAGGTLSSFSVEQLQTQVAVLKNRLACPVCHYRDKECIILRCRHMHCKQCVDERISNRSRKCPTCNVKFSENEVGDVWLS